MKKIISTILLFLLVLSSICYAHTTKQGPTLKWGEDIGWSIDENNHTNGNTLYYKFDSTDANLSSTYKKYVTDGAALWNPTINISENSNAVGTIYTFNYTGTTIVAAFCNFESDSSGHLTTWEIKMNRAKAVNKLVLAHEFGHAIGLYDLYNNSNMDKLMYGYECSTATAPTAADKMGARVISGSHSAHTFNYKFYDVVNGNYRHCQSCTVCNGYKNVEFCTYSNNVCTKCGITKGGPHPYLTQD